MGNAARTMLLALALGLFGLACSRSGESPMPAPEGVPRAGEGFDLALFQSIGVKMAPGHSVELIENGRVFDVLQDEIKRARSSVHIVLYIWRPSAPSDRIIDALAGSTARGVKCRIMVDPIGSTPAFQKEVQPRLEAIGCDVRSFRPLKMGAAVGVSSHRNHRKIVVVDGEVGITGGFGFWQAWMGNGRAKDEWRDIAVRVRGPAVELMQVAFAENWQEAGGPLLGPETFPPQRQRGGVVATFVASSVEVGPSNADRMTQLLIAAARKRLWIANAYFVPPDNLLALLEKKRREGVDVRVLGAGPVYDVKSIRDAQRSTYKRLLSAGVRIWEYQPSMMHAKTMVVDDRLAVVGSTNLDPLSLNKLEEGSLLVDDPALTERMAQVFLEDLGQSKEMSLESEEIPGLWGAVTQMLFRLLGEGPGR